MDQPLDPAGQFFGRLSGADKPDYRVLIGHPVIGQRMQAVAPTRPSIGPGSSHVPSSRAAPLSHSLIRNTNVGL